MAMMGQLKDRAIASAKPRSKPWKLSDGGGLYVEIMPSGSKIFRLKYRVHGVEGRITFGAWPGLALKRARELAADAKAQAKQGGNPVEQRRAAAADAAARGATAAANTFATLADEWYALQAPTWAESHASKVRGRLDKDLLPYLGSRPVAEIRPPDVLACIRRIEARGVRETAHRALSECSMVFRYGVATHRCDSDPTRDLRGALAPVSKRHFAAITEAKDAATLMRAIHEYRGTPEVRAALQLSALLFQRPGEIRTMEWAAIDLDAAQWRYTVSKTKSAHVVPLARQALDVLRDLKPLTGRRRYVFTSIRGSDRPMSENTVRAALRTMGYSNEQMTAHGFRAMARSLLAEQGWNPAAIERQLAHRPAGALGEAYDRSLFIRERTEMMQSWADFLDRLRTRGNVVAIRAA